MASRFFSRRISALVLRVSSMVKGSCMVVSWGNVVSRVFLRPNPESRMMMRVVMILAGIFTGHPSPRKKSVPLRLPVRKTMRWEFWSSSMGIAWRVRSMSPEVRRMAVASHLPGVLLQVGSALSAIPRAAEEMNE